MQTGQRYAVHGCQSQTCHRHIISQYPSYCRGESLDPVRYNATYSSHAPGHALKTFALQFRLSSLHCTSLLLLCQSTRIKTSDHHQWCIHDQLTQPHTEQEDKSSTSSKIRDKGHTVTSLTQHNPGKSWPEYLHIRKKKKQKGVSQTLFVGDMNTHTHTRAQVHVSFMTRAHLPVPDILLPTSSSLSCTDDNA